MTKIIIYWQKLPAPVRTWLKGLEVAVVTGVVTAAATLPFADFSSKAGIAKYAASIAAVAGGCVRLYLTQSPIQTVIQQLELQKTTAQGTEILTAKTTT